MNQSDKAVILKPRREESLLRFHPWVFSGAIAQQRGMLTSGDVVAVYSSAGELMGAGHFQSGSIAVRMLTFEREPINTSFWLKRLANAFSLRKRLGLTDSSETTAYRLVHGEGDFLPGLVIDMYGSTAVIQCHSVGMYLNRMELAESLKHLYGNRLKAVYDKSSATVSAKGEGIAATDGYLFGKPDGDVVFEYGSKLAVSWEDGQKTGFFLDQRENRKLLELYSKDAKVLNTFCYTGGFSVAALKGGAQLVHSVDSSQKAMELTRRNIELNFPQATNHALYTADTFEFFKTSSEQYDVIILDPPAFAKHSSALRNALQAYKRLNTIALGRIAKGGILFTFSCSQVVSREAFQNTVFTAAAIVGRNVRILHRLSQPADHPVSMYHPEGEYLKGLVLEVS